MILHSWIYACIILLQQMTKNFKLEIRLTFLCTKYHFSTIVS